MTFVDFILFLIIMAVAVFVAYKMRRGSSDLMRDQHALHRESQRAIKGDYSKKD